MKRTVLLLVCVLMAGFVYAQDGIPEVPVIKGYMGNEGSVTKYNLFNFLTLKDKSGANSRQSTGQYWEISYTYDSAFRQKLKFKDYLIGHIEEKGGTAFFQDTTQIHFAVPDNNGNIWGKALLTSNSQYKIRLIKEQVFENPIVIDGEQILKFGELVPVVELPPRITFFPNSVVTRSEQSKFNHYSFTYTVESKAFRQNLMGPYWEFKIEIQNDEGDVDKRYSNVQIQEAYYRAAIKAGGKIIKNRAREVIFSLPGEEFDTWARIMITMDGVYFVKVINQYHKDYQEPEQLYDNQEKDSVPGSDK